MGLRFVRGISESDYRRIVRTRQRLSREEAVIAAEQLARFCDHSRLPEDILVSLARAGAFASLGVSRRQALWEVSGTALRRKAAGAEVTDHHGRSHAEAGAPAREAQTRERADTPAEELLSVAEELPTFDPLSDFELVAWDYHSSSHSVTAHPLEPHRQALHEAGHPSAEEVWSTEDGSRASYVGLVITRQRPSTAGGTLFITLEDETGFVNLVVWKQVFEEYRPVLLTATLLGVEGRIQAKDGVVHLVVDHCFKPQLSLHGYRIESRNFR
jgi:error-prone DNA polymerase